MGVWPWNHYSHTRKTAFTRNTQSNEISIKFILDPKHIDIFIFPLQISLVLNQIVGFFWCHNTKMIDTIISINAAKDNSFIQSINVIAWVNERGQNALTKWMFYSRETHVFLPHGILQAKIADKVDFAQSCISFRACVVKNLFYEMKRRKQKTANCSTIWLSVIIFCFKYI